MLLMFREIAPVPQVHAYKCSTVFTCLYMYVHNTLYALIFVWFNIHGIRGLEAIRESLGPQKFRSGSCAMAKHGRP